MEGDPQRRPDQLNTLDEEARQLRADTGRYIRPIMLIQMERTGADQRECGHIHAEDANLKSMTQLVGRILRQPHAVKTGVEALDECHVITHRAGTATVVKAIKDGLEQDGLGDLVLRVSQDDPTGAAQVTRKIDRRPAFATTEIYLPRVMIVEDGEARDLDYETDVLASIDWRGFDPEDIAARIPENAQAAESQLQRIRLTEVGEELFVGETVAENLETLVFQPAHTVRMVSDIVPDP